MAELVVKEFTIGGNIVKFETSFAGIDVYSYMTSHEDDVTFYFTTGGEVIQELKVDADCGQNYGFISQFKFKTGE